MQKGTNFGGIYNILIAHEHKWNDKVNSSIPQTWIPREEEELTAAIGRDNQGCLRWSDNEHQAEPPIKGKSNCIWSFYQ